MYFSTIHPGTVNVANCHKLITFFYNSKDKRLRATNITARRVPSVCNDPDKNVQIGLHDDARRFLVADAMWILMVAEMLSGKK